LAVKGLQQLRNEIAGWLNRSEKGEFEGDDILIGPGSK
jgi:aspartate/methionine/tyrosine aminotransferase